MEALSFIGALCFGLVVGWVTSSTLRRAKRDNLTDIATVIGAIGGAAVMGLFAKDKGLFDTGAFAPYCIGLAIGFFVYIPLAMSKNAPDWLGEAPGTTAIGNSGAGGLPGIRRN
jgi:uncharacterized membrane protein YeaQ/YmgE (transglycosylase-associated protein family)